MISRNYKIYKRRKEHLTCYDMYNLLPKIKRFFPWLKEADSVALQQTCRRVDIAYKQFFKKQSRYPKFDKKRNPIQSYTTNNTKTIHYKTNKVKLPCIGWVRVKDKWNLPENAKICYATVIHDHKQYFVSICYKAKNTVSAATINKNNIIGLDYKSDGLYVSSNKIYCNMPHYYQDSQTCIIKEQRKLARKIGFRKNEKQSNNYIKQQIRLLKKIRHTANQRKDFLHKQSTAIAKQYDAVCVENLNMKAMANKGFGNGKATMDNGYGMFISMLEYKLQDRGKQLVKIDKWYPSSQLCSNCGHQQKMPLNIRIYDCPICGNHIDRDYNAAINIRNEGLRILQNKQIA